MPKISSPRPLDLTKPFVTSSQTYGSIPFDLSENLVTWYRDIREDFVPDLSGMGNTARCAGSGSHSRVTGSSDVPEFNSLNYPLRSFDLSANSTATSQVDHINSVNDNGFAASRSDHSFTDGVNDVPFTVSLWIKFDTTAGTQYIANKGVISSGNYEWELAAVTVLGVDYIRFRLYSQGSSGDYLQIGKSIAATAGEWHHFVITYDGSETVSGLSMYVDGIDASPTPVAIGSYNAMMNTGFPLALGSAFSNTNLVNMSTSDFRGKIHSFAIWKDRQLSSSEISALYNAYVNGSGGEVRSGFISRSPRLHLRELDDLPGSYSTVRRSSDHTRTGALKSNFNDETSIVFSNDGELVFPTMLPKSSLFSAQAVDIIGQESDISASLPIRSFQQPNHLHYSPTEAVGPFDENRVIPASNFYLSGTDPDVIPGFTSPVRSKIAIEIDITPVTDTRVMRNVDRRTVAEGGASIGDQTGFLYYNFERREWEQIGLRDPGTGNSLYYDYAVDAGSISGSFPMQFTISPGFPSDNLETRNSNGYSKIGTPTAALGAPSRSTYHATASQRLKMSNYISEPLLLEKVRVVFTEARAQRLQGDSPTVFGGARKGANRDVDNYVFFAYHQRHLGGETDSLIGVSSSRRDLIFSGSMAFWNSASFYNSSQDEAILSHTPAFEYNFGLPYASTFNAGQFTGSIDLEILPAVAGRQRSGISVVPTSSNVYSGLFDQWIGSFWPGGTSFNDFQPEPLNVDAGVNFSDFFGWAADPSFDKFTPKSNSRSLRSVGGESASPSLSGALPSVNSSAEQSAVSPYLLLPDDEIVLGLDAGVGPFRFSDGFAAITGSHFEIAAKPCKVIFYGSLIKNNAELLPSLNQDLSSNSVHEIIGAEPQLDQFQVEPVSSYYGTSLDEIVTGSMATPISGGLSFTVFDQDNSRRVISRVTLGQAGTTGSFQRFMNLNDSRERTYDSCLPDIFTFISQSNIGLTGSIARIGQNTSEDSLNEYENFLPRQFPFEDNPERFFSPEGNLTTIISDTQTYVDQIYAYRTLTDAAAASNPSDARMRDLVFRVGWKISNRRDAAGPMAHRISNTTSAAISERPYNSGSFRYGISSVNPEFTRTRWRYDRYGQFRDLLEPRQHITTFDGSTAIKVRFVSGSTTLFDPTDTHSQNISVFATSSLPYFDDGITRNRSDNPDEIILGI